MKRTCAVAILAAALASGCVSTEGGGSGTGKYMSQAFSPPPPNPMGIHSGAHLASDADGYQSPDGMPMAMMGQGTNPLPETSGEVLARATLAKQLPPGVLDQLKINPGEKLNADIVQTAGFGPGASCPPPGMPGGMPGFPGLPGKPGMGGLPPGMLSNMPPGLPILPGVQPPQIAGPVAAVGALTGGPAPYPNQRTEVRFVGPAGMKIAWYTPGPNGKGSFAQQYLEAPARYNFLQAAIYRLKLSDIPNRPGVELYPTLEVVPGKSKTCAFLSHSAVPVTFTEEDFEQVAAGNYVVKVIYLPDPQFQDLASTGIDELVSSRLEPGVDPIVEAMRRGSILLVIRLGNIDLEAPNTPPMDAPPPGHGRMMPPPMMAPGGPPMMAPGGPPMIPGAPPAMANPGPGAFGGPPLTGVPGMAPPAGMMPPVPGMPPSLPPGSSPPPGFGSPIGKADTDGSVQQARFATSPRPTRPTVAELAGRFFSGSGDKK